MAPTACGGARDKGGLDTAQSASAMKVALLTPGPISDQSWNGSAYTGLMRIRDSLGASVSHIQTKTPAEFEENFRQYGAQGYTLVFGHGFEFQDAAARVAPEFPRTIFVTTSGNTSGPNLAGIRFAFEEPSFMAGMLAGALTKTNVIGAIGGTELPPVRDSFKAFEEGAKVVNPSVTLLISYIGSWEDASAGKEQALAQIARKADVLFQNADAAGLGVFQAARESGKALVFGSNSNQNAVAPDVTVASVVVDVPHAFLTVARDVKAGTFKPRVVAMGSTADAVRLEINEALKARIPASALKAVDSVKAGIAAGTIRIELGRPFPKGS
ncbi:MAG: BMP family protein [Gemmatimonadaceae bacterium]|nr:BMP family protein [Gemmatimonadaceae bacterium]